MGRLKDPIKDALLEELRAFRRGSGEPAVERLGELWELTEALGEGIPERAFTALKRLYEERGSDPESAIGAYFYLSGWGVGLETIDQRRARYAEVFHCDISTAWRRAARGIGQLVTVIRDQSETSRPWAFISIFQSGGAFQPFLDFNLGFESWRPPTMVLDGQEVPIDFHLQQDPETKLRYTRRIVLPETPLRLAVKFGEPMATLRVIWPMPVWPVWQLGSWTADPRIFTRMRTFRQRAVEVSLEWWRQTPPVDVDGLVTDGAIWAERTDPKSIRLPKGWRVR